jgi:hypothetical protein
MEQAEEIMRRLQHRQASFPSANSIELQIL